MAEIPPIQLNMTVNFKFNASFWDCLKWRLATGKKARETIMNTVLKLGTWNIEWKHPE